jgi:PhnB protein
MSTKPFPDGYHSVTPYLTVQGAKNALRFYQQAFGAKEVLRFEHEGMIGHAEIQIGDSRIMLADESPAWGTKSPKTLGGTASGLALYVEDVDRVFAQALKAGATQERAVEDQFYGDRSGTLFDPFGHRWTIATHKEDVAPDEMQRRFRVFMEQMTQKAM